MNRRVAAVYAAIFLALFTLAVLFPAPIDPYADPGSPPQDLQPHWFLRPLAALLDAVPAPVAWGAIMLLLGALSGIVFLANSGRRIWSRPRWLRWPRMHLWLPRVKLPWPRRNRSQRSDGDRSDKGQFLDPPV